MITKKSARHKTIPHLLIQYMDDRGNPIEPTWDAATQKVALSIPGKLDAGSTSYSLTVKTHLQAGAGSVTVFDKGHPYDNLHCKKMALKQMLVSIRIINLQVYWRLRVMQTK